MSFLVGSLFAVIRGKDPSAVAVLMEDSAAVLGVIIASFSIVLTHLTGNHMYDALGSIAIGGKTYHPSVPQSTHLSICPSIHQKPTCDL